MGSVYFGSLAVAVTPPFNPVSLNKIMFWLNKKCSLVSLCVSDIKKEAEVQILFLVLRLRTHYDNIKLYLNVCCLFT